MEKVEFYSVEKQKPMGVVWLRCNLDVSPIAIVIVCENLDHHKIAEDMMMMMMMWWHHWKGQGMKQFLFIRKKLGAHKGLLKGSELSTTEKALRMKQLPFSKKIIGANKGIYKMWELRSEEYKWRCKWTLTLLVFELLRWWLVFISHLHIAHFFIFTFLQF